jgi:hypothetical protein
MPLYSTNETEETTKTSKGMGGAQEAQPEVIDQLAQRIRKGFSLAKLDRDSVSLGKDSVSNRLLNSQRARNSVYDPQTLQAIRRFGGSEIYDPLTTEKCTTAEAWLRDTLGVDRPWGIDPTPIPELPPEDQEKVTQEAFQWYEDTFPEQVKNTEDDPNIENMIAENVGREAEELTDAMLKAMQEEAKKKAEKMQVVIHDQLVEGGFYDALNNDFMQYLTTYQIGVIKGPVYMNKKTVSYKGDKPNSYEIKYTEETKPTFYAVDPTNMWFSPNTTNIDYGDIYELIRFQRAELYARLGQEGWSDKNIRQCLDEYGLTGLREQTQDSSEKASLENRPSDDTVGMQRDGGDPGLECVHFHGYVQGRTLIDWGYPKSEIEDDLKDYDISAILMGKYVVFAMINDDLLGRRPYHITSYEKQPGSIWGKGIPEKIQASQKEANLVRRSMLNNVAISSGPQVMVNSAKLPAGEDITKMYPWKIWQYDDETGGQAINFFQPNSNVEQLRGYLDYIYTQADKDSGIPRYVQGMQEGAMRGAAGTASGLSMLMNAANKSIKQVVKNIDEDITKRVVKVMYDLNMRDDQIDEGAKGDFEIQARGALEMAVKEQMVAARMDFLQLVLNSELVQSRIGERGIDNLLREVVKPLNMPANSIVPSESEMDNNKKNELQMMLQEALAIAVEYGIIDEQQANFVMDPESAIMQAQNQGQVPNNLQSPPVPASGQPQLAVGQ